MKHLKKKNYQSISSLSRFSHSVRFTCIIFYIKYNIQEVPCYARNEEFKNTPIFQKSVSIKIMILLRYSYF